MTGGVLLAGWLMFAQVQGQAAPSSPATPDVVQTSPQPAGPSTSAPATSQPETYQPTPAQPAQSDNQTEEPQTSAAPDNLGQGAMAQQAWEARLRSAYEAAEARQGPLDGSWRLTGADGDVLFEMVLSDPGFSNMTGAWRDLRRGGGADGSGFMGAVYRTADGVVVRFTESGQPNEIVLQLRPTADGRWGGEMTEDGAVRSVVLSRADF
jgi:hypothetical protein